MTLLASPAAAARLTSVVTATLCAGLLAAACSGPAGHPHADGRGASRLPGRPSAPPHGAPTVVSPTTPAAVASSPAARPSSAAPTSAPAPAPSATVVASPAPLAQCATSGLRVRVGGANGAAGSLYYPLDFTNISGVTCGMYGYPGVSFVSAPGGSQLGGEAIRNSTFGPALVTLAPGTTAHASVQVVVAQNYPTAVCKPVTAHWLRVYPPGQFVPLYAQLTAATCTGSIPSGSTLGIYVVRPGANGP
jgi:Protein of unknown function (DUF4232)